MTTVTRVHNPLLQPIRKRKKKRTKRSKRLRTSPSPQTRAVNNEHRARSSASSQAFEPRSEVHDPFKSSRRLYPAPRGGVGKHSRKLSVSSPRKSQRADPLSTLDARTPRLPADKTARRPMSNQSGRQEETSRGQRRPSRMPALPSLQAASLIPSQRCLAEGADGRRRKTRDG